MLTTMCMMMLCAIGDPRVGDVISWGFEPNWATITQKDGVLYVKEPNQLRRISQEELDLLNRYYPTNQTYPASHYGADLADSGLVYILTRESVREVNEVNEITDGHIGCPYGDGCTVFGCDHLPSIEATWKQITTTRVRITTLTFDWLGQKRIIEDRKVLWTKTRKLVKREEWVEQ